MAITPSSDRRPPRKLATKLPITLGSDTAILRHPVGNRSPDSHLDPVATSGTPMPVRQVTGGARTRQGTIVKGTPKPA